MRKRLFAVLLSLAMVLTLVTPVTVMADNEALNPDTSWYDGHASDTTFTLQDEDDLLGFMSLVKEGNQFSGKTVKLGRDMKLNPEWTVSETPEEPENPWEVGTKNFLGTFDGQGKSISGVYCVTNGYMGLFYVVGASGTVKNLTIDRSYFKNTATGASGTGAVAGSVNGGSVENVTVTDTVRVTSSATTWTGGIAGRTQGGGTISNCTVKAKIVGQRRVGGIVGGANNNGEVKIEKCTFTGNVTGSATGTDGGVGGIVGSINTNTPTLTVTDCYSDGTVTSTSTSNKWCGGILGRAAGAAGSTATISYCTVAGTVGDADDSENGGIVGQANNTDTMITVENCAVVPGTVHGDTNSCGQFIGAGGSAATNILNQNYTATPEGTFQYAANNYTGNADVAETDFDNKEDPVDIDHANHLLALAYMAQVAKFTGTTLRLTADVDMANIDNFPGFGTDSVIFSGSFDGNSHTVSHLTIVQSGNNYVGFFRKTSSDTFIENVTFDGGSVTGTSYVGAVAGHLIGSTVRKVTVRNVTVKGSGNLVGGIAGYAQNATITNCSVTENSTVTGSNYTGGLAGRFRTNSNKIVSGCTVTNTDVTGEQDVGGLIGDKNGNDDSRKLTISSCSASNVTVTATGNDAGGVLGGLYNTGSSTYPGILEVQGGTYAVTVTGAAHAGGMIGYINGGTASVTGAVVSGYVKSDGEGRGVGGVVGRANGDVTVSGVDCTADITAKSAATNTYFGGIVGEIGGTYTTQILGSRFDGSVTYDKESSNIRLGGLVGVVTNIGTSLKVENCLMAGSVTAGSEESPKSVTGTQGVGGVLGSCNNQSQDDETTYIQINKTLLTGSVTASGNVGTLIGSAANRTVQIRDAYYKEGVCEQAIGHNGTVTISSGYTQVTEGGLTGMAALVNAPGLFDGGKWCAVNGEICQLIAFREADNTAKTAMKVSDISTYRTDSNGDGLYDADFSAIAPDGMVFAGWYSNSALTEMISSDVTSGAAYAVFVDAGALRVWCQYKANQKLDGEKIIMRILTTVPGTDYDSVTFMFAYGGNSKPFTTTHFRKTISGTDVNGDDISYEATAKQPGKEEYYWCGDSMYIGGYNVGVKESLYDTELIITAGWTTNDGTFVTGGSRSVTLRNVSYLAPAS